jgi:pimeloyl-ACP methyl ester carboxylesterase
MEKRHDRESFMAQLSTSKPVVIVFVLSSDLRCKVANIRVDTRSGELSVATPAMPTPRARFLTRIEWRKLGLVLLALQGLTGCVSSMLATMAVKAPNQQTQPRVVRDEAYRQSFEKFYAQKWTMAVAQPAAQLSVAIVEPGNYRFAYQIVQKQAANGQRWLEPKFDVTVPAQPLPGLAQPRGTILVLHGYRDAKENVAHWALAMAQNGFRSVLVDFRGHGQSTGDMIGFGAFEVDDLRRVIDDLQQRGLAGEKVGVIGVSYGASVGLLLAAKDSRVAAVVALEPFSSAEKALVEFAHGVAPQQAAKISEADFQSAVVKAARKGNFSWSAGDVLSAMDHISVPVLFYHGEKDTWISPEHSRALQQRAKGPSRLVLLPKDDHILLSMRLGDIWPEVRDWFLNALGGSPIVAAK